MTGHQWWARNWNPSNCKRKRNLRKNQKSQQQTEREGKGRGSARKEGRLVNEASKEQDSLIAWNVINPGPTSASVDSLSLFPPTLENGNNYKKPTAAADETPNSDPFQCKHSYSFYLFCLFVCSRAVNCVDPCSGDLAQKKEAWDEIPVEKRRKIGAGGKMVGRSQNQNQKDAQMIDPDSGMEFSKQEVDSLLNEKMKGKNKFDYKGKSEQMADYIKKLRLCIKWFQDLEQNYLLEQEKLRTLLESTDTKCTHLEIQMKNDTHRLESVIARLNTDITCLQDKLALLQSEKMVTHISTFACNFRLLTLFYFKPIFRLLSILITPRKKLSLLPRGCILLCSMTLTEFNKTWRVPITEYY